MRKALNICIVFLLLFSTSGVAISKHYCGELLQKIAFTGGEKSCCEGQEMPEDCCKDEVSVFKSDDLKLTQNNITLYFSPFLLTVIDGFIKQAIEAPRQKLFSDYYNSPPPLGQDIVIHVQSFLL